MAGRECGVNGGERLVDYAAAVGFINRGSNGVVDGEADCAPAGHGAGAGHHVESAVDGDRNHGEVKLHCKLEGSFAEGSHVAGECARPLGEHYKRHAVAESALGFLHCAANGRWGGIVDEDVACGCACGPYYGELQQPDFHHPAEVVVEVAVDGEDVVGTLVVGHKDVGCAWVDVLTACDFHAHESEDAEDAGPIVGGPVAPESATP